MAELDGLAWTGAVGTELQEAQARGEQMTDDLLVTFRRYRSGGKGILG